MRRGFVHFLGGLREASHLLRHLLLAIAVLSAAFALRLGAIRESLPYPRHPDETTWADIALRMMREGDPNPRRFRKPSLPVYLMTGGFSIGLVRAKLAGDAREVEDLGTSATPYYLVPSAAEVPKALFAAASVVALALIGGIGYLFTRDPWVLWLAPLLSSTSVTFHRLSWSYMNVDVIGAAFALCTLTYLVRERMRMGVTDDGRGARRAVIAGVLAGLTVGSKYNLFPILLPCVLWFLLFERKRWFARAVAVGAASLVTFLATTPYAILDFHTFRDDVLKEVNHYASGHGSKTIESGLPMAWKYIQSFLDDFGLVPLLLALSGWALLFRRDRRLALVVSSYPVVFLTYMCLQRVFFVRNVVVIYLFLALGIAVALRDGPGWLAGKVSSLPNWPERVVRVTSGVVLVVAALASLPWKKIHAAYAWVDPRNAAERWIRENVEKSAQVVVDGGVEMDLRSLKKTHRVAETDMPREAERFRTIAAGKRRVVLLTHKRRHHRYVTALAGKKGSKGTKAKAVKARFGRVRNGGWEAAGLTLLDRPRRR